LLPSGEIEFTPAEGDHLTFRPGDVCRISLGRHREVTVRNPSPQRSATFLAIWFRCAERPAKLDFDIDQQSFTNLKRTSVSTPLISGQGHEHSVSISLDCAVYLSSLGANENLLFETLSSRRSFIFVLSGAIRMQEHRLLARDSAMVRQQVSLPIAAQQHSSILLIDLP
jgi:redox-sensitive bicupin YhaK (pirin superfamily)